MKVILILAGALLSTMAYAHVHEWQLVDQHVNEDGEPVCSWLCDYTGIEYRIETVGCWNPND